MRRLDLLPNGERIPNVHVERLLCEGSCCWSRQLVEVQDDLETRYLAAQRSALEFALTVPNHGKQCCPLRSLHAWHQGYKDHHACGLPPKLEPAAAAASASSLPYCCQQVRGGTRSPATVATQLFAVLVLAFMCRPCGGCAVVLPLRKRSRDSAA